MIFDDLKRFARDTVFHFQLRQELAARGATVECLNFTFEDTPEGEFIETILAAQGQLERKQNRRQVRQKMQARIENGYWVFHPPYGYRYIADPEGGGKILVRNEPEASNLAEALEGFASGSLITLTEVKAFLERKDPSKRFHLHSVIRTLRNELYAGYICCEAWSVPLTKARHDPLIDMATFQKIQANMEKRSYAPTRKDMRPDFPLRGAVCCEGCERPMTAAWSKGKCKSYAYYVCQQKGCVRRGKSIPRDKMHEGFRALLSQLTPSRALVTTAGLMFKEWWNHQNDTLEESVAHHKNEIAAIDRDITQTLERIMKASNQTVIDAYEKRIEELERNKLVLVEKAAKTRAPKHSFDLILEHSLRILANPLKLWDSGRLDLQRLVLKLTFAEHLVYCKETGYRTPKTTLPFKVLAGFGGQNEEMVRVKRIELSS